MNIRPVRTEEDYKTCLKQIEGLMGAKADTPEGDLLDILTTLVEAYERRAYPMEEVDPVDVIRFYMEQNSLTPKDLANVIGNPNRVYEVLNHKRPLTLRMIRNLHESFGISADALIKKSKLLQATWPKNA